MRCRSWRTPCCASCPTTSSSSTTAPDLIGWGHDRRLPHRRRVGGRARRHRCDGSIVGAGVRRACRRRRQATLSVRRQRPDRRVPRSGHRSDRPARPTRLGVQRRRPAIAGGGWSAMTTSTRGRHVWVLAGAAVRRMARHLRHAARPHPGARQARRRARAPEPQLQHAALRLTARGWETPPLPAPDGSGALVVALDLHHHDAVVEHSDGRPSARRSSRTAPSPMSPARSWPPSKTSSARCASTPRPRDRRGQHRSTRTTPRPTTTPPHVATYFEMATQAALVLAALRAPYRGRSSPVNAWWGTFDLAVSLFSGQPVDPPSNDFIMRNSANAQQIEVGWWPGDHRYPHAAFFAFAFPTPEGFDQATLTPAAARLGHRPRRVPPGLGRRTQHAQPAAGRR